MDRFANYPLVQLIDLDAAMGRRNNSELVREFARQLPCQVGGGIRSVETANSILEAGARRVILGSSLISDGAIDTRFAEQAASEIGLAAADEILSKADVAALTRSSA